MQLIRGIDIDGRESDFASQLAPRPNASVDEICATEGQRYGAHRSFVDGIAHDGARDANAANAHFIDSLNRDSVARAGGLQLVEVSLAAGAETEITADAHFLHVEGRDQELLDEAIGGPARELVRERDDQQSVDAHRAQELLLLRQREDLLRNAV